MAPQQITALWVYVGRRARYADSVPALKLLADKGAATGAGQHDGLVIAGVLACWWASRCPILRGRILPGWGRREQRKGLLKAELNRRNVTYKDLSARLEAMGIHETARTKFFSDMLFKLIGRTAWI